MRSEWCALVGITSTSNEGSTVITEIMNMILLEPNMSSTAAAATSKNRESVNQAVELNLASRYTDVVAQLVRFRSQTASQNLNSQQQHASTPQQLEP